MTAIVASRPPASETKRLRMTRSRTLSSAPPMTMTVPSVTASVVSSQRSAENSRRRPVDEVACRIRRTRGAGRRRVGPNAGPCQNARAMSTVDAPMGRADAKPAHERRAGVQRRALRREISRLHYRRRILAMALLIITFGFIAAGIVGRGEPAGADARAYWAAVRIWLNGGDPYHPTGPFLPYVYAPWMLPLFAPWALLPWDVAWFVWRGGTILGLLWTIEWAYRRRPLETAVVVALLGFPIGANLDTGNINLLLTLMVWAARFSGPVVAGFLWSIATWMKWAPALLFP